MATSIGELFLAFNTDTSQLQRTLNNNASGIGKSFGSLFSQGFGLGAGMAIFNKIADVAGKVWSYFTDGAQDAYKIQLEAETKIETVMKQRMKSTAAEVQSIKDLASEIQSLGVIGDEVSLSGAQQLATFLNSEEALKTLMPAMDNLLAQQKGLNASAGDAVSVGNLMGKVMQGQTSALTRVGITFTAAQEKVLKYGNEQERAAMLAQVITDNVGEMNKALANTDLGRQQQLSNTLGDIKEKFGQVYTNVKTLILPILNKFADMLDSIADKLIDITNQMKDFAQRMGWLKFTNAEQNATKSADVIADVFEDAADDANKSLEAIGLMGFDTIQKLGEADEEEETETIGTGAVVNNDALEQETTESANIFDKLFEKIKPFWDRVAAWWEPRRKSLSEAFENMGKTISDFFADDNNQEIFKNGIVAIGSVFGWLMDRVIYFVTNILPKILPTVLKIIKTVMEWLPGFISNVLPPLGELLDYIGDLLADLFVEYAPQIVDALIEIADFVAVILPYVVETLKPILWTLMEIGEFLLDVIINTVKAIPELITAISVTLAGVAIGIFAIFDGIYKAIEFVFKLFWELLMFIMVDVPEALAKFVVDAANVIVKCFADMWEGIKGFFSDAAAWLKGFWDDFLEFAKAPINGLIGLINGLIDGLNSIGFDIPDWLGGGHFGINISHIPQLADGGIVQPTQGGTLANIAEAGQSEAVVPLDKFWTKLDAIVIAIGAAASQVVAALSPTPQIASASTTANTSGISDEQLDRLAAKIAAAVSPNYQIDQTIEIAGKAVAAAVKNEVVTLINRDTKLKGRSVII